MLTVATRKQYMIDEFGVTDWTDQDHADVAYYLAWNCPLGVQQLRALIAPPPKPQLGFRAALASVEAGAAVGRLGVSVALAPIDIAAVDWVVL